jgi:hypothetical protein
MYICDISAKTDIMPTDRRIKQAAVGDYISFSAP